MFVSIFFGFAGNGGFGFGLSGEFNASSPFTATFVTSPEASEDGEVPETSEAARRGAAEGRLSAKTGYVALFESSDFFNELRITEFFSKLSSFGGGGLLGWGWC